MPMRKYVTYKLKFVNSFNLRQSHYQILLIVYLKSVAKYVEIKTENLSVSLKGLKITNFLITTKSVEKNKTVKSNK